MWSQLPAAIKQCYATLNPGSHLTMFNLFMQLNLLQLLISPDHDLITSNTPYKPTLSYATNYVAPLKILAFYVPPGQAEPTHHLWFLGWRQQAPTKPFFRLSFFNADTKTVSGVTHQFQNVKAADVPDFASVICHPLGVNVFSQACPYA